MWLLKQSGASSVKRKLEAKRYKVETHFKCKRMQRQNHGWQNSKEVITGENRGNGEAEKEPLERILLCSWLDVLTEQKEVENDGEG